jgi:hypothetical protein
VGNLSTTDYIEGAAAAGLLYWGFRKASGWEKWGAIALAAYFAYNVWQDYSGGSTTSAS